MSRKPRLDYARAVYPVMNRGNQQKNIFLTDEDRKCFLATLGKVCERSGWKNPGLCPILFLLTF